MKCGHLFNVKIINSGFGSLSTWNPEKLSGHMLAAVTDLVQRAYRIPYRQCIGNVPFAIRIFGQPMRKYFHLIGTDPLEKRAGRPVILKDSTLLSGRGFHVLFGKHSPFQKSSKIMLAPSGILFTIIMLRWSLK